MVKAEFDGRLVAIAIARQAKGPMENVEAIEVVTGEGLRGDRYGASVGAAQFKGRRSPEKEVTLMPARRSTRRTTSSTTRSPISIRGGTC